MPLSPLPSAAARDAAPACGTGRRPGIVGPLLLAGLLWSAALVGQEPATPDPTATEVPESEVAAGFEAGIGRLLFDGRQARIAYTLTLTGALFDLETLVSRLGGTLEVGPLGKSHELDVFGNTVIIGPDSPVMTIGDEIVPMSRAPLAGTGGLMVPLDFLRRTWGDFAGYAFRWSRATRTLQVERRPSRELETSLDLVHIAGVSTLVMRFVEEPSYRYQPTDDGFELVFPGDRLVLRGSLPPPVDLIEDLEVLEDRVRVALAPNAEAAEPYRVQRGNIQVITDIARGRARGRAADIGNRPRPIDRLSESDEMRIILDPGHGGEEVGAVGANGTLEKDLTLSLARRLQRSLEARLPVRVLLTRDTDVAVDHRTRTALANEHEADLFISLHLNSVPGGGGVGAETYFLDLDASDRQAAESARQENAGAMEEDSPVQLMLWDLAQSRHMESSQDFARLVQRELNQTLGLRDRGVKQAPFLVLVGATMPAVLVEFGFLSNPQEEEKLQEASYQQDLVEAVVRAVAGFRNGEHRGSGEASGGGVAPAEPRTDALEELR